MNKIGILTFHRSINYGSVLQAFALQQAVNELGFSTEIIDYEPHHYDYMYALFRPVKSVSDIKHDVANFMYMRVIMEKKENLQRFAGTT